MLSKALLSISFIVKIFLIFATLNSDKMAQNLTNSSLDSLYNTFIHLRTSGGHFSQTRNEIKVFKDSSGFAEKCGFSIMAAIYANFSHFSASQQAAIKMLDKRPELTRSIVSPKGHFRIHYNDSGSDVPSYNSSLSIEENVRQVAVAFDSAYSFEVDFLGFLPPPGDGNMGGDILYDIYIINYNGFTYAETVPEMLIGNNKYTTFIKIDNDFSESRYFTHSFDAMRVTAAHELHHAIQMGGYAFKFEESFFHELTSTAMEDFVFDDVNDYYKGNCLKRYFANPAKNYFINSGYKDENGYCIGIWDIFLKEKYGFEIIKKQWELFADYPALKAINLSLLDKHSSFKNEFNEFGIWTFFTGYRAEEGKYFKEASHYPVISYLKSFSYTPGVFPVVLYTQPVSNTFISVLVSNGLRTDTIAVKITDGDVIRALINPYSEMEVHYDLFEGQKENSRRIVNNYFSKMSSKNTDVLLEADFFNDLPVNGDEIAYSEADYAYPNPYSYSEFGGLPVSLPAKYNDFRKAEIKIFSSGMLLVYCGTGEIFDEKSSHKYFVSWSGLDSKGGRLPTGVYIYVTSSNGEIRKGKLVIKNN